jgi:hypothetical protein
MKLSVRNSQNDCESADSFRKAIIRGPSIESRHLLFNSAECPIGLSENIDLSEKITQIPLSEPSMLVEAADGSVEVVENFRFHISASDLKRSMANKSNLTVSSKQEMFMLDSKIGQLLENAEKEDIDGKVVYRLKMDYEDLMKNVSKIDSDRSIAEEKSSSVRDYSRSVQYNETMMCEADITIANASRIGRARLKASNRPPPLALTVAEMSLSEISENLVGTAFVGITLTTSIIVLNFLSRIIFQGLCKLLKQFLVRILFFKNLL